MAGEHPDLQTPEALEGLGESNLAAGLARRSTPFYQSLT
jgi:hypothetical protein